MVNSWLLPCITKGVHMISAQAAVSRGPMRLSWILVLSFSPAASEHWWGFSSKWFSGSTPLSSVPAAWKWPFGGFQLLTLLMISHSSCVLLPVAIIILSVSASVFAVTWSISSTPSLDWTLWVSLLKSCKSSQLGLLFLNFKRNVCCAPSLIVNTLPRICSLIIQCYFTLISSNWDWLQLTHKSWLKTTQLTSCEQFWSSVSLLRKSCDWRNAGRLSYPTCAWQRVCHSEWAHSLIPAGWADRTGSMLIASFNQLFGSPAESQMAHNEVLALNSSKHKQ